MGRGHCPSRDPTQWGGDTSSPHLTPSASLAFQFDPSSGKIGQIQHCESVPQDKFLATPMPF